MYVGKTNNPDRRWRDHCKVAREGKDRHPRSFSVIHAAIQKYGQLNFIFKVIEEHPTEDAVLTAERLYITELEKFGYVLYNCNSGGDGPAHSEETKKKISLSNTGKRHSQQTKNKISSAKTGHAVSEETAKKISQSKRGAVFTEIHKEKLSISGSGIRNSNAKLTEKDVRLIRNELATGTKGSIIARRYGVSPSLITYIKQGKLWPNVK